MSSRASMLKLLARMMNVLPPTLHPNLPPHLVETLLIGSSDVRQALFALLHTCSGALAWIEDIRKDFSIEALSYAFEHGNIEDTSGLLEKAKLGIGWIQLESQMSLHAIKLIGLHGLREPSVRATCIRLLQRAVFWGEGEAASEALYNLLDLLYVSEPTDEHMQCLKKMLLYFSRGKRHENNYVMLAYGILRHVLGNINSQPSAHLVSTFYFSYLRLIPIQLAELLNTTSHPTVNQMLQIFFQKVRSLFYL